MTSPMQYDLPAGIGQFYSRPLGTDTGLSSQTQKQSLSVQQALQAGLTIQTKEGDRVTLTSDSYARYDAFMYDSRGVIDTGDGSSISEKVNHQQITLSSGEQFSFFVKGDLNSQELADINDIVKGIDAVISEVVTGDMNEAVEKAMAMNHYDSISMFQADISYQQSYRMTSEIQSQTRAYENQPVSGSDDLFKRMLEQLEKVEEDLVARLKQPVEKLFQHHLGEMKNRNKERTQHFQAVEAAARNMNRHIENISKKVFKDMFSML